MEETSKHVLGYTDIKLLSQFAAVKPSYMLETYEHRKIITEIPQERKVL